MQFNPLIVIKFIKLSLNKFTGFVFPPRCMAQMISLVNPTHETLELQATNSNPENFVLDVHRSVVSIFGKPSYLPLLEHFPILSLGHHGILAFDLFIRF